MRFINNGLISDTIENENLKFGLL